MARGAIAGFDHVVIATRDLDAAVKQYEALLGRAAMLHSEQDGVATALIALDNIAVELMAPVGDGEASGRLSTALKDGEGLKSLVFATHDIEALHRRCDRVGLAPENIKATEDPNRQSGHRSFRLSTARTHGVRLFAMQRDVPLAPEGEISVTGLDHVVIQSPDMEHAAALYGARLDLDMRLDREVRGRRLMFLRCGDAIVEIAHVRDLERDVLWGLSWRVSNADATRTRLATAGLDVSEVRPGMKPGTRVFTVRITPATCPL